MRIIPAKLAFKTKIKKARAADGSIFDIINYKREVSRSDCNLLPHEHDYYNSDLFMGILNRAYQSAIEGKQWVRVSELPNHISVDRSKFLAVVTISIEV